MKINSDLLFCFYLTTTRRMDYLMILLREYEKNRKARKKFPYGNYNNVKNNRFIIISKEYGFIDWLVKNDKIDFNFGFIYHTYDEDELGEKYSDLDSLIMILSIQDNPLEYLCSILK